MGDRTVWQITVDGLQVQEIQSPTSVDGVTEYRLTSKAVPGTSRYKGRMHLPLRNFGNSRIDEESNRALPEASVPGPTASVDEFDKPKKTGAARAFLKHISSCRWNIPMKQVLIPLIPKCVLKRLKQKRAGRYRRPDKPKLYLSTVSLEYRREGSGPGQDTPEEASKHTPLPVATKGEFSVTLLFLEIGPRNAIYRLDSYLLINRLARFLRTEVKHHNESQTTNPSLGWALKDQDRVIANNCNIAYLEFPMGNASELSAPEYSSL
ncbi:hypothetical protein CCUS01_03237 [Colletotrichum cuscutae]|uniref:Uncharacterized protein n=1 Tax=Colletotrichum cuscutae TaxID=1209917 RepID=A0AAJ0DLJ6_9PEZI|nr:hypothetical protein CCUS01_03237 [Colletotrichum cuscutae]